MTMGNPLAHWELMVTDVAKAKEFYGKVFDWEYSTDPAHPEYGLISTGSEPGGGIMAKPPQAPVPMLTVYFMVDSVDETLEKATAAGGSVVVPKTPIPGHGAFGVFVDPDEIGVGIFEAE
jgi:predicted enzyme related to lactoylglutathione lyase